MCLIAMSKDFFERDRPKPELSGDEDFPDKLLWGECLSSCLGGASFRIFITLSTIFVPYMTGLTLSLALAYARLSAGTELLLLTFTPFGGLPLEGEHDWRLILPLRAGSTDEDRILCDPGLPLVPEIGLSESEVRKFGGASREKPGISEGFHGMGFTTGELTRGGTGYLEVTVATLGNKEGDLTGGEDESDAVDRVVGLRIGVVALDVGLDAGNEEVLAGSVEDFAVDLAVGVEDLAVEIAGVEVLAVELGVGIEDLAVELAAVVEDLAVDRDVGVEDLAVDLGVGVEDIGVDLVGVEDLAGTVGLVEVKVAREVGVEDLEGLDVLPTKGLDVAADEGLGADVNTSLDTEFRVGRRVGVADLGPGPPDEEGLLTPPLDIFNPGDEAKCLDAKLLAVDSSWTLASLDFDAVG